MILHNLKSAVRSMGHNKLFSGINVIGLAIGIASSLLILAWVQYEYSYNHFIGNYKDIYQVKVNLTYNGSITTDTGCPLPMYYDLRESDSRIKDVCFTSNCFGHTLRVKDKTAYKEVLAVSKEFLAMFDIPIIKGDVRSLDDPYSIMINENVAKEFFGDKDPIGQFITYDNEAELKVTGVYKNVPYNSDFWFMALIPADYDKHWINIDKDKWDSFYPTIYLRLHDNSSADEVSAGIGNMIKKHFDDGTHPQPFLHQLDRWHLYSHFEDGVEAGGKIEYVRMFTWIAVFILIIACINYVNLSTARSERRAREVGIRKVIGSRRLQLIWQFMIESFMSTALALVLAIVAVGIALPSYNSLVHARITLDFTSADFWLIAITVFVVTAVLSGFYPAFFFSSRKPVDVLRGNNNTARGGGLARKILVVAQFSISIFLAIGVLVVYQQIDHARQRNLGYEQKDLVCFAFNNELEKNYDVVKNKLLKSGVVEAVTKSNEGIDVDAFFDTVEWPGKQTTDKIQFSRISTDHDFATTMRVKIISGRDFNSLTKTDTTQVLINETAAKMMAFEDPIGQKIKTRSGDLTIIGVTQDVVRGGPFSSVNPCYIGIFGDGNNHLTIRLTPTNDISSSMTKVLDVFKRTDPLNAAEPDFLDERFNYNFRDIKFVGELAWVFAAIAIFLTCLGVVGLAAYTAEQKTKEIAIRKVLGATVASVIMLLSNYFVRAAILSVVVASPVAWLAMDKYLEDFDYRIDVPWWVIPATALLMLVVTLMIVFIQTSRAANANPVSGLRRE
ncbi:MAG: ABC transporter permease [Bacteroidota bacterium]